MDDYLNEEDFTNFSYDEEDFENCPPEVTEGLFSKCDKKGESSNDPSKKICACARPKGSTNKNKATAGSRQKRPLNAFIIFYLEMYAKTSGKHVTCVAKEAGKRWCSMSEKDKEKYRVMARARKAEKSENKC